MTAALLLTRDARQCRIDVARAILAICDDSQYEPQPSDAVSAPRCCCLATSEGGWTIRVELSRSDLTIGRGPDCDLQVGDDRISTHHCRISFHHNEWTIRDLQSLNRTFVNDVSLTDRPRRLNHGDVVRLGTREARLFEARFVTGDHAMERRNIVRAANAAVHIRVTELEAALAARDAEVTRIETLRRQQQGQLAEREAAATGSSLQITSLRGQLQAQDEELAQLRTDLAVARERADAADARCAGLEAQLDTQNRRMRREIDDAHQVKRNIEIDLKVSRDRLAATQDQLTSLITERDGLLRFKTEYDDLVAKLATSDLRFDP